MEGRRWWVENCRIGVKKERVGRRMEKVEGRRWWVENCRINVKKERVGRRM